MLELVREAGKATGRGYFIGKKLKEILREKGVSKYYLAKQAGFSPSTITGYIKDRHAASPKAIEKIARVLDIPETFFFEEEPPKTSVPTSELVEREYIAIPIITGVGAGGEVITDNHTLIKRSKLPRLSVSGFEVKGDSMEPTIPKGWIVLIDPDDRELAEGKVYLFAYSGGSAENGLLIRRVHRVNNEWELVPDNRRYAPQKLTDEFKIVGRVIKKIPKIEPMDVE
ncbi:XRE family transcriptional regulator [Hydrogenivirga sp.]